MHPDTKINQRVWVLNIMHATFVNIINKQLKNTNNTLKEKEDADMVEPQISMRLDLY